MFMLYNIIKIKKEQLEQQFNRRVTWWPRKRWHDVIAIPSELEGASLLTCDINNLSSVKLFNLTPEKLQVNLQAYWKKPAWRRWLQRCFSSINQQLEIWSYYQQCLALRKIQDAYLTEQNLPTVIPSVAFKLQETLANFFTTINSQFEVYLSKQSTQWFTQQFEEELTRYEQRRRNQFFQCEEQLEEQLKMEPSEKTSLKHEIKEDYDKVEKIMRAYLAMWGQGMYLLPPIAADMLLSVVQAAGTSTSTEKASSEALKRKNGNGLSSVSSLDALYGGIKDWVKTSKEELSYILQDETAAQTDTLPNFFEEKLTVFTNEFINKLLQQSTDTTKQDEKYKQALLKTIGKVYKQASLFFHPDTNRDLINLHTDRKLVDSCWSTIFNSFRQCCIASQEKLTNKYGYSKKDIATCFEFIKLKQEFKKKSKEVREAIQQLKKKEEKLEEKMEKYEENMEKFKENVAPMEKKIHSKFFSPLESQISSYLQETDEQASRYADEKFQPSCPRN
jgi:hypothetical protein